ncbi:MAG: hypothetical protein ACFFDI_17305 [Promethearchaeota archaeon]
MGIHIPLDCFQREPSQHRLRDTHGNKWLDLLTDDYDEGNGISTERKPKVVLLLKNLVIQ